MGLYSHRYTSISISMTTAELKQQRRPLSARLFYFNNHRIAQILFLKLFGNINLHFQVRDSSTDAVVREINQEYKTLRMPFLGCGSISLTYLVPHSRSHTKNFTHSFGTRGNSSLVTNHHALCTSLHCGKMIIIDR